LQAKIPAIDRLPEKPMEGGDFFKNPEGLNFIFQKLALNFTFFIFLIPSLQLPIKQRGPFEY